MSDKEKSMTATSTPVTPRGAYVFPDRLRQMSQVVGKADGAGLVKVFCLGCLSCQGQYQQHENAVLMHVDHIPPGEARTLAEALCAEKED